MNKKQREEVILMERKDPAPKISSFIDSYKIHNWRGKVLQIYSKFVSVMFVVFILFVSYSYIYLVIIYLLSVE